MFSRFSSRLHRWARGWLVLALLTTLVVFVALTMPRVVEVSGDIEGLDTRTFYTPEEAFSNVAAYSEEGRDVLLVFHLTADIVNPLLYSAFLNLLISWLFTRAFAEHSKMYLLNLVPIGAGLADLLENISIAILLATYPAQLRLVAWAAALGTLTKFIFILGSAALILIGLVSLAVKGVRAMAVKRPSSAVKT